MHRIRVLFREIRFQVDLLDHLGHPPPDHRNLYQVQQVLAPRQKLVLGLIHQVHLQNQLVRLRILLVLGQNCQNLNQHRRYLVRNQSLALRYSQQVLRMSHSRVMDRFQSHLQLALLGFRIQNHLARRLVRLHIEDFQR